MAGTFSGSGRLRNVKHFMSAVSNKQRKSACEGEMEMKKMAGLVTVMVMAFGMVVFAAADELPVFEKTDRFDVMDTDTGLSMLSRDGELVIHVGDGTEIIFEDESDARECLEDGQTLAELLNGRNLTVSYSITTRSIPPQTTPEKIVILYEIAVPPIYELQPDEFDGLFGNTVVGIEPPVYEFSPEEMEALFPLNGEIVVNGQIIDAPAPYYLNGVAMVPLQEIAEALGFEVIWDDETQGVRLGVAINLWIGKDYYTVGKITPIELGVAPELIDEHIYIPYTFFREVVSGYAIYVFEGQVVIEAADR